MISIRTAVLGLIALNCLLYVGFGLLLSTTLAEMLQTGFPKPSAEMVLARYTIKFVVVPAAALALASKLALLLHRKGREVLAMATLLIPLLCWPFVMWEALK